MKTPASNRTTKTAAEKAYAPEAFLYNAVSALAARLLRALHYKVCVLIVLCLLLPGYGDSYVTYAVGSVAVYTTSRVLINNVAVKRREVSETEQPVKCNKVSGNCTKSEGITDGSLWN